RPLRRQGARARSRRGGAVTLGELVGGRVVVVTGASRGLGAGLAEAFGGAGARLGPCARGPGPAEGPDLVYARVDVTDEDAVERFADDVEGRLGPIDLWINNAGVLAPIAPLVDLDGAELRRHLEINVVGVWAGTRAFVRRRRRHGGGG